LAYAAFVGEIPAGMEIDHTCHKKSECKLDDLCPHRRCVNPDHLEAVSKSVNVKRSNAGKKLASHCKKGHAYTAENTRTVKSTKGDYRLCRTCVRESQKHPDAVAYNTAKHREYRARKRK
jgi:hypothetical protein